MQDVQTQAIRIYQNNLSFLQEKYPQKYDLEYKNNYFDVLELASGKYLYNENSLQHAQKMSDLVTYSKNDHTIATFQNLTYELPKMTMESLKNINPIRRHASISPIIHYYNNNIPKNSSFIHIYKYMFFGTGLGLHIEKIRNKINADVYFIVEDDIELFRLSLFTCNYKKIFENKFVHFCIAQNNSEFSQTFQNFYTQALLENHYLKFSVFSSKDEKYIKKVQTEIMIRPEKVYEHHALLLKNLRVMQRVTQGYKFLNMLSKEDPFFTDKPILILGAGPSLGKNKKWLKENHHKFIIIAPFVTLRLLYQLNIKPNIIVHIDENDVVANIEVEFHKEHLNFFEDTLFIFAASVSDIFFQTFQKDKIYLLEERTSYKLNDNLIQVASVGETVYAIGLSLSKNQIYLLGLDLSITDDGKTHMDEHNPDKINHAPDVTKVATIDENLSLRKTTLLVPGNFRKEVPTIPLFEMSIRAMNFQTKHYYNPDRKIYNLNDGALFNNTLALHIENIDLNELSFNTEGILQSLQNLLDHYSSNKLTEQEIQMLYEREKRTQKYYALLKEFSHASSTDSDIFIKNFANLTSGFLRMQEDELHQIFLIYILEVFTYPVDILSTKELTNKKRHIKKIKKMIIILLENILDIYTKYLEKLLQEIKYKKD